MSDTLESPKYSPPLGRITRLPRTSERDIEYAVVSRTGINFPFGSQIVTVINGNGLA